MATARIYTVSCYKAYEAYATGTRYSLHPWGHNTPDYEGEDDGGVDYLLPDGYEVAESISGSLYIYDSEGGACALAETKDGLPAILTPNGGYVTLRRDIEPGSGTVPEDRCWTGPGLDEVMASMEAADTAPDVELTAEQIAAMLRAARANNGWDREHDYYDGDLMRMLCRLAGMSDEWAAAPDAAAGGVVVRVAAAKLGVVID